MEELPDTASDLIVPLTEIIAKLEAEKRELAGILRDLVDAIIKDGHHNGFGYNGETKAAIDFAIPLLARFQ